MNRISALILLITFFFVSNFSQNSNAFSLKKSGVFLVPQTAYADILEYAKSADQKLDLTAGEVDRVERCFYSKDWMVDRADECYWITDLADAQHKLPTLRDVQFRIAYARLIEQSKADEELVKRCFRDHRFDHFAQCKGISWNDCEKDKGKADGKKKTEREKLRKFHWDRLAKADPEFYALEC